jgi:hypothetical protein
MIKFYKNIFLKSKNDSDKNKYSTNFRSGYNFWRLLSLMINSAIRGYNYHNKFELNVKEKDNIYGLARYMCIVDNHKQIYNLDKWLHKLNKYYSYKICESVNCPKILPEIESLYNWFFRYKKDPKAAIRLAKNKLSNRIYFNESDEKLNNEYIQMNSRNYVVIEDYYEDYYEDSDYKELYEIPTNFNIS